MDWEIILCIDGWMSIYMDEWMDGMERRSVDE